MIQVNSSPGVITVPPVHDYVPWHVAALAVRPEPARRRGLGNAGLGLLHVETRDVLHQQFGADPSYLDGLRRFGAGLEVRISLKAGLAEGLLQRTGAAPTAFELPFRAIEQLLSLGARFHVAAMSDPSGMPAAERAALLTRLSVLCDAAGKRLFSAESLMAGGSHDATDLPDPPPEAGD